jgi:hypothetical protein
MEMAVSNKARLCIFRRGSPSFNNRGNHTEDDNYDGQIGFSEPSTGTVLSSESDSFIA